MYRDFFFIVCCRRVLNLVGSIIIDDKLCLFGLHEKRSRKKSVSVLGLEVTGTLVLLGTVCVSEIKVDLAQHGKQLNTTTRDFHNHQNTFKIAGVSPPPHMQHCTEEDCRVLSHFLCDLPIVRCVL